MPPIRGDSATKADPGVSGTNSADGEAVLGTTDAGTGVLGRSNTGCGVWGGSTSSSGVGGMSDSGIGVHGVRNTAPGVRGDCAGTYQAGVVGINSNTTNEAGWGVYGTSRGAGVFGESTTWHGVYGKTPSTTGGAGVCGEHPGTGPGVLGISAGWCGVVGTNSSDGGNGVFGENKAAGSGVRGHGLNGPGGWFVSQNGEGVHVETQSPTVAAVAALNLNPAGTGAAVYARKAGDTGHAGFFDGHVNIVRNLYVGGDISLVNADFAEEFDLAEDGEPGMVMVLDDDGAVRPAERPYDGRVAGVLCGAGSYRPGLILDRRSTGRPRHPVALVGKVYCLVDARETPVAVGDLLTTSARRGHAMRATDPWRAFGAVIGKALGALRDGVGLVPVLVALR